ncbi:LysR family transcriptional regulator [Rhodococcus ruber BKS 20-38]|uniref:LysR family transcriptional regulator n=1 Tax=Rhodococcus ruber BKS 20-38 TaxID=1278076 RepID=M2Z5B1_9NOCA|nr:LysR family transcriptional regulator [Rhodococcus ruber]EME55829.1 LysR family transcriptional regulator [Rhodococcus ruber BKS 20-38]
MDFRQVEYFLAVVENNGINGAAAALGVAQPTVSQALRSLERELGVELFHRIGRGMVLTAAGRSLVGPSRQILRDVTAVEELLTTSDGAVAGRLDIMAFPSLSVGPLVELIARFRREYPKVAVRLSPLRDEEQVASLIRDGHCEFVVAHLPLEGGDGLEVIELGEQEYWLAFPPGFEVPDGPIHLSELPDIPMVFAPTGASMVDEVESALRAAGARPEISVLVGQREVRLPMVAAGLGGSIVDRVPAEAAGDRVVVRACEPRLARAYGLAFDPASLSAVGQAFVDLVRRR